MKWLLIILTALAFSLNDRNVLAQDTCTCLTREPLNATLKQKVKYNVKASKAVFSGKVVEIEEIKSGVLKGNLAVRFEVKQTWKNADSKYLIVITAPHIRRTDPPYTANCGYNFEVGKAYLVYVESRSGSKLITGACSRTQELRDATEELEVLDREDSRHRS